MPLFESVLLLFISRSTESQFPGITISTSDLEQDEQTEQEEDDEPVYV